MDVKMEADCGLDDDSRDTDSVHSRGSASQYWPPNQMPSLSSGANAVGELGRPRKVKDSKVCGVCGDKALGYNFDAISCESCKAFFRRNAHKGIDYFKCPYDERCRMDQSNRRFCKRCRLKKCFEIGMRKEYILTDEEKMRKRRKIEENRSQRKMSTASDDSNPIIAYVSPSERDIYTGVAGLKVVSATSCSSSSTSCGLVGSSCGLVGSSTNSCGLVGCNASCCVPTMPCEVSSQTVALCPSGADAIAELTVAYRRSLDIQMDRADLSRDQASFADLVNIAELSIRRVIAMAKQIRAFKSLPQCDQIQLLKGGSIELLIIRSVITFDKERLHFLDPLDSPDTRAMNIDQLRCAETGTGLFEDHMKFVRSLAVDLQADETTLILLLVISLFSPDRARETGRRDLVAHQQEFYSALLQSYVASRYPATVARAMFPRLLMKLTDIRNLNEEHSHVLLKVNPEGIQPLMKEVLDLSH